MPKALYQFKLDKNQKRNVRISKEDEEEIKGLYALGIYSQNYLAKKFGVSQPCVNYMVNEDRRAKKVKYQKHWAREHRLSKEESLKRHRECLEYKEKLWNEINKGGN